VTAGAEGADLRLVSEAHRAELAASVIPDAVAQARGYRTLYGSEEDLRVLKDARIPRWAWRDDSAFPGLWIPLHRVSGEEISAQFKPAVPQLRNPTDRVPQKYASPVGALHLDVPPAVSEQVRDTSRPLWITEGVKKADCLAGMGLAAVTLTGVFNWRNKQGTIGDWEDVPLRGRTVVVCFDADAATNRNVMMAMRRLGRWLESKGVAGVRYLIVPSEVGDTAVKGVDDWFAAGGTLQALGDAALRELPSDGPQDAFFSDAALADLLCSEELDGTYRWASGLGWMRWNGRVWKSCTDVSITETVRLWALEQFGRVIDRQRADPGGQYTPQMDGWRSVLSANRQRTLVGLAKGILECAAEEFDAHPDLLNCPNGVVDLRTGALMSPDPDLLMSRITGTEYVKGATHADWDQALTALPDDVRDWFQLRIGQAATGYQPDGVAVVSQGGGGNGKSTVMDGIAEALGQYYIAVADRAMMGAASDNHPTEMMDFMGARIAVLEETPESRHLDTVRLKKLVDTKDIKARRIRQDSVQFPVTHALFVNTNFELVVVETDHGTWRRLALLRWPFTYRRTAAECLGDRDRVGDPTLKQRIDADPRAREAVLAWVVAGAQQWYAADRIMPEHPDRVRRDTAAWRMKSDPVLGFATDRLVFDRNSHVLSTELFAAFSDWMHEQRNKEWSQKLFLARFGGHDACAQHGVELKKIKPRNGLSRLNGSAAHASAYAAWLGLRFQTPEDVNDDDSDPFSPSQNDHGETLTCTVPAVPDEKITGLSREIARLTFLPELPEPDLGTDFSGALPDDPFGVLDGTVGTVLDTPVYTAPEAVGGTPAAPAPEPHPGTPVNAGNELGDEFDWEA
jgi:P4 family phage/plasmid primase-like protien